MRWPWQRSREEQETELALALIKMLGEVAKAAIEARAGHPTAPTAGEGKA